MNPNNSILVSSSRNPQARFRWLPFTASRVGKLAACLILLASSAQAQTFTWSAPVPFGSLNADQILTNFPGTTVAAAMSAGGPNTVTLSSGLTIIFAAPGVWADLAGGTATFSGAFSLDTGNTNFNACLNSGYYDGATHTITMNNLVVGKQYSVQLFALDDRSLTPAGSARTVNWQDPADGSDISATYTMADNAYIVGTFTAASTSESIQENMLNANNGNFNCLVLRAVGWTPPPSFAVQPLNSSGFLGESAKLTGSASGDPAPTYQWKAGPAGGPYTNLVEDAKYSGTTNTTLIINNLTTADATPVYVLVATNPGGSVTSREASIIVQVRALVGKWFTNNTLADVSGFSPAGTHDGYDITGTGSYVFTNDVPPSKTGQSLLLYNGDTGIAISNSSTADANYTNTFDNRINNSFTVGCFAKGWPGVWNPFVSKWGENGVGWQLRQYGGNGVSPCWTIRGTGENDDMAATGINLAGDTNNWHFYVGTYDAATRVRNLYVDGELGVTETNNGIYALSPPSHLCIGARDNGTNNFGNYFTGEIYDVRVYNSALSGSQILDWYGVVAPTIADQPASAVVFDGSKAKFTVTASGTPPLTYQWQLNGTNVNLLPDAANFTGTSSNVLTILSVTTNDVGSYRVIITSTLGYGTATSSNAYLAIVQKALVGQWFTNGTLNDLSGHTPAGTHDGYIVGGGSYYFTNDVPQGENGQSIQFGSSWDTGAAISNTATADGSTYTNTFDTSEFSVAFWAEGRGGPWYNGRWDAWVAKDGYNNDSEYNNIGWSVGMEAWSQNFYFDMEGIDGGGIGYTLGDGLWGNGILETGQTIPGDDNWHHYVTTYSPSTGVRSMYFDGKVVAQQTGDAQYTFAPDKHLTIGCQEQTTHGFTGFSQSAMFDVRFYNYALSSNEVALLLPTPVISTQPPPARNAYVGVTTRISATVTTFNKPTTNQWQFNGTNLVDGPFGGAIISGSTSSSTLTIANPTTNLAGVYRLIVSYSGGTAISSNTTLTVLQTAPIPATNLVGAWFTGATNLADSSGYSPAGTHDGYGVNTSGNPSSSYGFTNDVPPGTTGQSLALNGSAAIAITNSATADGAYTNTFDDTINTNGMTVTLWAKGLPGGWNPWASKAGDNGTGWQLRVNGSGNTPCWTMRGPGNGDDMSSTIGSVDGNWHLYAGTYDPIAGIRNLYVNGVLAAQETGQGAETPAADSHLLLGGRENGAGSFGNYFTGEIYGVRIYNTALSEAEVNSLLIPTVAPVPAFSGSPVLNGNKFVLTYTGTLLSATNVAGPYLPVAGATSPYTNNVTTAPQMFYKLSNP